MAVNLWPEETAWRALETADTVVELEQDVAACTMTQLGTTTPTGLLALAERVILEAQALAWEQEYYAALAHYHVAWVMISDVKESATFDFEIFLQYMRFHRDYGVAFLDERLSLRSFLMRSEQQRSRSGRQPHVQSHPHTAPAIRTSFQMPFAPEVLQCLSSGHPFAIQSQSHVPRPRSAPPGARSSATNQPAPYISTVGRRSPRLRHVPTSDSAYDSVIYQFTTGWRHTGTGIPPPVRFIYEITRVGRPATRMQKRHEDYLAKVGNEQQLWHATTRNCRLGDNKFSLNLCMDTRCSLCQIIRRGFQKRYASSAGMYGKGIYVSTTSSKAAIYSNNTASPYHAMLLNKVAVGKAFRTHQADNRRTAPPPGYNSVCGLPGHALRFDETCVYNNDAIRPSYLVIYDAP